MNDPRKISVIMGVYNGGLRTIDSIESIENQEYENWEFIICDDCSNDESFEILSQTVKNNAKIKVIRNDRNIGLAATLNKCIQYCNGQYIARMDDDDISYPDRFLKQIEFLERNPNISFVSSSADIYDGQKIVSKRINKNFPTKIDLIWNSRFIHPATMFRAEVLKSVGGYRVSSETTRGQDYDLFMRLYGKGYLGANIQDCLFRYTEDRSNFKRRTFKARIDECKIRYIGYKSMGVLPWAALFIVKPFFAYLFSFLKYIKRSSN